MSCYNKCEGCKYEDHEVCISPNPEAMFYLSPTSDKPYWYGKSIDYQTDTSKCPGFQES
jgi:hypothetical protein